MTAFLSSDFTEIALLGQTPSHFLHPMQPSVYTTSENSDNFPNIFWSGPKGHNKLWKIDGLYLNVIITDINNQINKIGIFLLSTLLANSIRAILTNIEIHATFQV